MVRWGDCDPAGIIYTPKAIDYALETIENWLIEEIGISWMDMRNKGKGLASVKFDCEYLAPMKAETFINVSLNVKNLGESSIDLFIEGVDANSNLKYFNVNLRGVYIKNNNGKLNSIKIENELRDSFLNTLFLENESYIQLKRK